MGVNTLQKLYAAFQAADADSGLPPDGTRRAKFEQFVRELWRLDTDGATEVARVEGALRRMAFRAAEFDGLRRVLEVGERIVEIMPRSIRTDRRVIERDSLRPARPAWVTVSAHERELALNFPSEAVLNGLDEEFEAERRTAEAILKQNARSANDAAAAQQQIADSQRRAVEAYEDALAAVVERSRSRREGANGN